MSENGLSVNEAIKKLEYYCSYQDRCYKEVITKLKSLGMFQTAIDHILDHLVTNNFLNEERFAKSFARGKHKFKFWGKRRIEQELKFRDISSFNIKIALKEIEADYLSNFYTLAEKKWLTINEDSLEKKKRKWVDYLMRKGYESQLIFDYLKELQ
ncbi:RecX family transcriptional regulator [Flavobacterium sp. xlx-214]|uniref:regulatory protein RecX n=1 Tax=unclassified Flavobacterium TaxID=196869 RepID=UPI0013D00CF7|nr:MULTISPECIES: regulatory protein RecX [unclassified Flavobacterium]MBA5793074.1 RecX family transcriptional regulator [Flavobacterium sp. xlx-221]QMI84598.1 RecX family transcriptional regulator [Flavobacterium sp. xlx-214]